MVKYKIIHERNKCIGCGACTAICPDNWMMAKDGKSKPKKIELTEIGCNQEAADSCPAECIHVKKA